MDQKTNLALLAELLPGVVVDPKPGTPLKGCNSPETAVYVSSYPYGRRLRCVMRYWLESSPKKGTRMCSQTNNPKISGKLSWNAPKKSTYASGVVVLYVDTDGHIHRDDCNMHMHFDFKERRYDPAKVDAFSDRHGASLEDDDVKHLQIIKRYMERENNGKQAAVGAVAEVEEVFGAGALEDAGLELKGGY